MTTTDGDCEEDCVMAVVSKIRPVGNSKGIILPQGVLEQLHGATGSEVDELEVRVEGKRVILIPHKARIATSEEFAKAKSKVFTRHRQLMKNLANR
jgi:antitoxin component of MazEF toxin-antitoxin module